MYSSIALLMMILKADCTKPGYTYSIENCIEIEASYAMPDNGFSASVNTNVDEKCFSLSASYYGLVYTSVDEKEWCQA